MYQDGDVVIIHKPKYTHKFEWPPTWTSDMDKYDGEIVTVRKHCIDGMVVRDNGIEVSASHIEVYEAPFWFNVNWVEPYYDDDNDDIKPVDVDELLF